MNNDLPGPVMPGWIVALRNLTDYASRVNLTEELFRNLPTGRNRERLRERIDDLREARMLAWYGIEGHGPDDTTSIRSV